MQVILNKKEKEQLVIKLYDANSDYCNNKSKDTKALYLLSIGKNPLDVAIRVRFASKSSSGRN
jgi:hypothetical protein